MSLLLLRCNAGFSCLVLSCLVLSCLDITDPPPRNSPPHGASTGLRVGVCSITSSWGITVLRFSGMDEKKQFPTTCALGKAGWCPSAVRSCFHFIFRRDPIYSMKWYLRPSVLSRPLQAVVTYGLFLPLPSEVCAMQGIFVITRRAPVAFYYYGGHS